MRRREWIGWWVGIRRIGSGNGGLGYGRLLGIWSGWDVALRLRVRVGW